MLRIPCPKCQESSYTPSVESFQSCPHCGFVFSGIHGPERRSEIRIPKEIRFILSYHGQRFKANTFDVSKGGVGIRIFGDPPVFVGDILNLKIKDLRLSSAKAIWVKHLPDQSLGGLQRLN